jgi:pyruvate dehydrogenase E2 component (dihydrolipoamide acetyltransferase)
MANTHQPTIASDKVGTTDPFEPPSRMVALSGMRRTIGARLVESKRSAPHFYLSIDIDLDAVVAFRDELKRQLADATPTVNDCLVAATARALLDVPDINARIEGQSVRLFQHANVGVAVALPGGLVVPVLPRADTKDLVTLSEEMAALAGRARTNKLTPDDYRGGTFTVSNLGMFGIKQFVAILNPPQAGILALGQGVPRAIVRNGEICAATLLTATLSADHRVVDGVAGAPVPAVAAGAPAASREPHDNIS